MHTDRGAATSAPQSMCPGGVAPPAAAGATYPWSWVRVHSLSALLGSSPASGELWSMGELTRMMRCDSAARSSSSMTVRRPDEGGAVAGALRSRKQRSVLHAPNCAGRGEAPLCHRARRSPMKFAKLMEIIVQHYSSMCMTPVFNRANPGGCLAWLRPCAQGWRARFAPSRMVARLTRAPHPSNARWGSSSLTTAQQALAGQRPPTGVGGLCCAGEFDLFVWLGP
jgi:hypothetical protein